MIFFVGTAYAATPFFADGGLTKNGIEWCEENYQLYQLIGNDFFEHHQHSIESRVCASLYNDPLWMYSYSDRYEKLIEQSRMYTELEIKESEQEAKTGIIDTKPAIIKEIPQNIAQQQKEMEEKLLSDTEYNKTVVKPEILEVELESSEGGGCLIATATYGTELAPQIQQLRELRDTKLLKTDSGKLFMNSFNEIYYSFSPNIADMERENPIFKEIVKVTITPMISSLSIMSFANSEQEVFGYGISVIMINLGMYVVAPAMMIYGICKIKSKEQNL